MERPWPCESKRMGKPLPVTGAETRTWRSTARPGAGSTMGLTERTCMGPLEGLAAEVGSLMILIPFRGLDPMKKLGDESANNAAPGEP